MKKRIILLITFICVLIDQVSKYLIIKNFTLNTSKTIISSFFSITYVRNTGAAWGMFSNNTILLTILSLVFLLFAIRYIIKSKDISKLSVVSYSLLLGGIIGNLIDRVFRNYVIDFLSFKIFSYDYPIFNIADTFIVVSIFLIVIETIIKDKKEKVK